MRTETTSRPLRELIKDFNTGRIQLPQFQRDYVWKPTKIRNLLDSLFHVFPVGGFYLWRPSGAAFDVKPRAFGGVPVVGAGGFVGYLIDGQQRLTSLEAAYALFSGEDKDGSELRCYLDLIASDDDRRRDTRLFVTYGGNRSIAKRVERGDPTLVAVREFYDGLNADLRHRTEDALRDLGLSPKRLAGAIERFDGAARMLDQLVPCTTVSDIPDDQAVEVFHRLNKGGTPLRQSDVQAAALARGAAVSVLKQMRDYASGVRPQRMGIGFSFAFRALVVFHRGTAEFKNLKHDWMDTHGPHGRTLAQSWKATERGLNRALEFVDKMGWCRSALIPSTNALILLAAALERSSTPLDEQAERGYRRWLCLAALRGTFRGSVATTMNRFLRELKTAKRGEQALLRGLTRSENRKIQPDELNRVASLWGAATQVLHAYLVAEGAKDWLFEEDLDRLARTDRSMQPSGELTVHHIFPRKVLATFLDEPLEANRLANFALISRSSNSQLGDRLPDEVLATMDADQRRRAEVQFFGAVAGDKLNEGRFAEFCEWRSTRLADALNQFLAA